MVEKEDSELHSSDVNASRYDSNVGMKAVCDRQNTVETLVRQEGTDKVHSNAVATFIGNRKRV
jgi:hypothetical protein